MFQRLRDFNYSIRKHIPHDRLIKLSDTSVKTSANMKLLIMQRLFSLIKRVYGEKTCWLQGDQNVRLLLFLSTTTVKGKKKTKKMWLKLISIHLKTMTKSKTAARMKHCYTWMQRGWTEAFYWVSRSVGVTVAWLKSTPHICHQGRKLP